MTGLKPWSFIDNLDKFILNHMILKSTPQNVNFIFLPFLKNKAMYMTRYKTMNWIST